MRKGTAGARRTFEARRKRVGSVRTSATQVPNSPSPSLNSSSGLTQSPRSRTVLSAAAPPYRTACRATRRREATRPPSHTVFSQSSPVVLPQHPPVDVAVSGRSSGVGALNIASAVGSARPARGRRAGEAATGLHAWSCARLTARAAAVTAPRGSPHVL
jgi:hypothetical protein